MRYELTDHEWAAVRSMLPNKPRGAPRVDDRRFLNGIFLGVTPEHDGAICRRASAHRPAITASFAGVGAGILSGIRKALHGPTQQLWSCLSSARQRLRVLPVLEKGEVRARAIRSRERGKFIVRLSCPPHFDAVALESQSAICEGRLGLRQNSCPRLCERGLDPLCVELHISLCTSNADA